MNYNMHHFLPERREALEKEIDLTIVLQQKTVKVLIDILLACNGNLQSKHHDVFINMLAKIRLNLGSCIQIMPTLRDDYRFKVSTNLLYRAIIDDLINLYYLHGFILTNDKEQDSLNNELSMLHKEFLRSSEEIINSEAGFKKYVYDNFNNSGEKPTFDTSRAIAELRKANPEVYDIKQNRWKNGLEVRATSHPIFINRFPKEKAFISESQKIDFIRSGGFQRHHALSYLFKYFSQYQHFSPKMHIVMLMDNDYDLTCYQVTLMELTCSMSILLRILNVENKDFLNAEVNKLIELIVTKGVKNEQL